MAAQLPHRLLGSSMANQPRGMASLRIAGGRWWSAALADQPGQHHLAAARSPSVGAVPASALPALAVA
jgi:hypothetical protein